ncbi:hypothetical protein [Nocardia sp. NPDC049149]|uniref:hypothetical protein n=1 Tax=Nocardia sp. NPDC049149 TaxID=3364315 RepID=UPI0037213D78
MTALIGVALTIMGVSIGIVNAIVSVSVLIGFSVGVTYLALGQARRAAFKNLRSIFVQYTETRSPRALYGNYINPLLELPATEQVKMFNRLAEENRIEPDRRLAANQILESGEFGNALDRVRAALAALVGTQA